MKPASNKSQRDDLLNAGVIASGALSAGQTVRMVPDQVTYYFQQQQQQQQQQQAVAQPAPATLQPQIIQLQVMIRRCQLFCNFSANYCRYGD
jgi:sulfate adenylyltransferase subunit 1 (EFTu-like GTPase family)